MAALPLRESPEVTGQAGAPFAACEVRELDAVFAQQLAAPRDVGDDRLVRVDQVRVGRAAGTVGFAAGVPPRDPYESEVPVHGPLLVVDARAQQLAGALLGAPLATRVVQVEVERAGGRPPGGAVPAPARRAPHHDRG